jgi:hypothetical protein
LSKAQRDKPALAAKMNIRRESAHCIESELPPLAVSMPDAGSNVL